MLRRAAGCSKHMEVSVIPKPSTLKPYSLAC